MKHICKLALIVAVFGASAASAKTFDLGYGFTCGSIQEFEKTVMTSNGVIAKGFLVGGSVITNIHNTEMLIFNFQAVNGSTTDRDIILQLFGLVSKKNKDGSDGTGVGFAYSQRKPFGLKAGADGGSSNWIIVEKGIRESLTNICWRFDAE